MTSLAPHYLDTECGRGVEMIVIESCASSKTITVHFHWLLQKTQPVANSPPQAFLVSVL